MDKYDKLMSIIHKFLRGSGIKFTGKKPTNNAELVEVAQEFLITYKELLYITDLKELSASDLEFIVECTKTE